MILPSRISIPRRSLSTAKNVFSVFPHYEGIEIVDTAGNDDFSVLVDGWIGEGDGFLLVFAINDATGFAVLNAKRSRILKVKEKAAPPMMLLGNKCDLADLRQVKQAEAKSLAESWKMDYMETSAKVPPLLSLG